MSLPPTGESLNYVDTTDTSAGTDGDQQLHRVHKTATVVKMLHSLLRQLHERAKPTPP